MTIENGVLERFRKPKVRGIKRMAGLAVKSRLNKAYNE